LRFLLIDDSPTDREIIARRLQALGDDEILEATGRQEFEAALDAGGLDVILTDYHLSWGDGLQVLRAVKQRYPHLPVVMVTDSGSEEVAVEGMKTGLGDYVLKRHLDRLSLAVSEAIVKAELVQQHDRALEALRAIRAELEKREGERAAEPKEANAALLGEIAEHRHTEQMLRATEGTTQALAAERERLEVVLHSIGDGVIATDRQSHVVLMNPVAEYLTGWSEAEALGRPLEEVFSLSDERTGRRPHDPIAETLTTGLAAGSQAHSTLSAKGGTQRTAAYSSAPIRDSQGIIVGAVIAFQDTTQHRKLEDDLLRANKLESLGILAGGIAHDFNNLLTAVLGNVILARMEADPRSEQAEILLEAERAAIRAKDLTQQLLTFARGGAPVKRAASLGELLRESTSFVLRGSDVICHFDVPEDSWPVEVDEGQIAQVIQNLVINADEAMPSGGAIRISVENVRLGQDRSPPLAPGRYVRVAVSDQGIGIPQHYVEKIFDPYFTTKQKGSGLGLAICYTVVKRHEGHIGVESQLGRGTTFYVYLPASRHPAGEQTPAACGSCQGGRKVLVMDDEEFVRKVARKMLERLGCVVEVAHDGEEAIAKFEAAKLAGSPFDVLVMDLTVPGGMGGKEAVGRLLDIDPLARVVVSSGYSNDPVLARFREHGFRGVINKPYRMDELQDMLSRVLAEES